MKSKPNNDEIDEKIKKLTKAISLILEQSGLDIYTFSLVCECKQDRSLLLFAGSQDLTDKEMEILQYSMARAFKDWLDDMLEKQFPERN